MIKCKECGAENSDEARYCTACGAWLVNKRAEAKSLGKHILRQDSIAGIIGFILIMAVLCIPIVAVYEHFSADKETESNPNNVQVTQQVETPVEKGPREINAVATGQYFILEDGVDAKMRDIWISFDDGEDGYCRMCFYYDVRVQDGYQYNVPIENVSVCDASGNSIASCSVLEAEGQELYAGEHTIKYVTELITEEEAGEIQRICIREDDHILNVKFDWDNVEIGF